MIYMSIGEDAIEFVDRPTSVRHTKLSILTLLYKYRAYMCANGKFAEFRYKLWRYVRARNMRAHVCICIIISNYICDDGEYWFSRPPSKGVNIRQANYKCKRWFVCTY